MPTRRILQDATIRRRGSARRTHGRMPLTTRSIRSVLRALSLNNRGQDLIEYALVVALIAFAAAAGMTSVATQINAAFTNIGTKVTTYTS
jgi:pilus assembly protein Flp/PilA